MNAIADLCRAVICFCISKDLYYLWETYLLVDTVVVDYLRPESI